MLAPGLERSILGQRQTASTRKGFCEAGFQRAMIRQATHRGLRRAHSTRGPASVLKKLDKSDSKPGAPARWREAGARSNAPFGVAGRCKARMFYMATKSMAKKVQRSLVAGRCKARMLYVVVRLMAGKVQRSFEGGILLIRGVGVEPGEFTLHGGQVEVEVGTGGGQVAEHDDVNLELSEDGLDAVFLIEGVF